MQTKDKSLRVIENLFRQRRVVELDDLHEAITTNSHMTIFRRLQKLKYLSSYTHAGRYYTLYDIPQFNRNGLWHYESIGFSRQGSLKKTVMHLVNKSGAGTTHSELEKLLQVRAQNTLLNLVNTEKINRKRVKGHFLYVSIESKRAKEQIARRSELKIDGVEFGEQVPEWVVIEVLAEVIRGTAGELDAAEVTSRLRERGVTIRSHQVKDIFERCNLKKTPDLEQQDV